MAVTLDGEKTIEVRRHRFCFNAMKRERGSTQTGMVGVLVAVGIAAILAPLIYITTHFWPSKKMSLPDNAPAECNQAFLPSPATFNGSFELQQLETVAEDEVILESILLEGTFGRVHQGLLGEELVLVKLVDPGIAEAAQKEVFLQEALRFLPLPPTCPQLLRPLSHSVSGTAVYPGGPWDNLQLHLASARGRGPSQQILVKMALDILRGVEFLHCHTVVHRDLATRNCWIREESKEVVLADDALSRDLFPRAYHCLGDNSNRPLKWMAPESLSSNIFTPASDMWMFGVVLWEILTLGQEPYQEVDPDEMEWFLGEGFCLAQPPLCPEELYVMMSSCFAMNPSERPAAPSLLTCLQDFAFTLNLFI